MKTTPLPILAALAAFVLPQVAAAYQNPVSSLDKNVHILHDGTTFYRYRQAVSGSNLIVNSHTSTNLTSWGAADQILSIASNNTDKQGIWPANNVKANGSYWLHYPLIGNPDNANAKNIWCSSSGTALGNYGGHEKVVDQDVGVIDPTVAVDGTARFLLWKRVGPWGGLNGNDGAIHARQLDPNNLKNWKSGSTEKKLIGPAGITWTAGQDHTEAPAIFFRANRWFLMYTSGHPDDATYAIGYGTLNGDAVMGDYTNRTLTNPILKTRQDPNSGLWTNGPGAGEVVQKGTGPDSWWILYSAKSGGGENMHLDDVHFTDNLLDQIKATNGSTQPNP